MNNGILHCYNNTVSAPFWKAGYAERRAAGWAIVSYSLTADGLYTPNGWFRTLEPVASEDLLGTTCLAALAESREGASSGIRVWEMLGFVSRSAYVRGARSVAFNLLDDGKTYRVTPLVRVGSGFQFPTDYEQKKVDISEPVKLGGAILGAMELAR